MFARRSKQLVDRPGHSVHEPCLRRQRGLVLHYKRGGWFNLGARADWEQLRPLGAGGQSDVFLVRRPDRSRERAHSLEVLNQTPAPLTATAEVRTQVNGAIAQAIWSYARPDLDSDLAALKAFKLREAGPDGEEQALNRLRQEIAVLQQNRHGLPKLLDFNEGERWIVTEYFRQGTLEAHPERYKGRIGPALKSFQSLLRTVSGLHTDEIVHRDIKPANVFVENDGQLVLGDFGIVYLPNQPKRLTRTNESVGPHDYMPPWADRGGKLGKVEPNFDVYMLGKLLWCMVTGRLVLQREWFKEPENDVTLMFREDPHAHIINVILEHCVVERPEQCLSSASDLLTMVNTYVELIERGGQDLHKGVPRPCRICGHGYYEPNLGGRRVSLLRLWNSGGATDISTVPVEAWSCSSCGHIQFFRSAERV